MCRGAACTGDTWFTCVCCLFVLFVWGVAELLGGVGVCGWVGGWVGGCVRARVRLSVSLSLCVCVCLFMLDACFCVHVCVYVVRGVHGRSCERMEYQRGRPTCSSAEQGIAATHDTPPLHPYPAHMQCKITNTHAGKGRRHQEKQLVRPQHMESRDRPSPFKKQWTIMRARTHTHNLAMQ